MFTYYSLGDVKGIWLMQTWCRQHWEVKKVKAFPYSILSVGPGADLGVQAVSPQVTVSNPSGGSLPLLSARPVVTSPAAEHHRPLAATKLYCLVTEAHRCEQLAEGCYAALARVAFEPATYWSHVQCSTRCTTAPPTLRSNFEEYGHMHLRLHVVNSVWLKRHNARNRLVFSIYPMCVCDLALQITH